MAIYTGVNGVARNVKEIYIGVNGVARKVVKAYVGVDGKARLFWTGGGLSISDLPVGTLIKLNENGSGVNFYVAKHDYESGLNGAGRTLLVRQNAHTSGKFSNGTSNTITNIYANNLIDTWHNNTYKPMLSTKVRELIGTTKFYYTPGGATSGSAIQVTTLSRSVFQLSMAELGLTASSINVEGSALPIASTLQVAYDDGGTKVTQWTRSARTNSTSIAGYVGTTGSGSSSSTSTNRYYRPAFTLPATAIKVNPEPNADGSYTLIE